MEPAVFFLGAYVVVPLALRLALPARFRWLVLLGLVAAVAEWVLAYRSASVEGEGDWQPGLELTLFTGILALIVWLPLWVASAAVGRRLRLAAQRLLGRRETT